MQSKKLLVVEDDNLTRTTLAASLQYLGHQVSIAKNVREAILILANEEIEVAVIDLDLGPGPNGLDLIQVMENKSPQIGIVLLTSFVDPRLLNLKGQELPDRCVYLIKQSLEDLNQLNAAIEQSAGGGERNLVSPKLEKFTQTQLETMRLIAQGLTNAEIAKVRFVSEKAVEQAISKITKSLDIANSSTSNLRVQITREYFRLTGRTL